MEYSRIIELVKSTKDIILGKRNLSDIHKKGRANFVTEIDYAVQEYLRSNLEKLYPEVIMFSEEQENNSFESDAQYWILDPIDGTQNLIRNLGMSAVSLAYFGDGILKFGVVYNPFTEELFSAEQGRGAFCNGKPIHVTDTEHLIDSIIAVGTSPYDRDFSKTNFPLFQDIYEHSMDIRRSGSAALDLCYVAAGRFDGYLERNLKPWDMAAGTLIVAEAGGTVSNYSGSYPEIGSNTDVCAGNGRINQELIAIIGRHLHK